MKRSEEEHPWGDRGGSYDTKDDIQRLIEKLPEGEWLKFDKFGYDIVVNQMKAAYSEKMKSLKGKIHIVAAAIRQSYKFAQHLELNSYEPDTDQNTKFDCHIHQFSGLSWDVLTIPAEDRHLAEASAAATGWLLKDTVPVLINGLALASLGREKLEGDYLKDMNAKVFPLRDNVVTLERPANWDGNI